MSIIEIEGDTHEETSMDGLIHAASQREVAEVQGAIAVAKRFPRNQQRAYDQIMIACQRKSLAEVALYQYNRGGTNVEGPSIRLAETLARCWGNIQFGIRELEQANGESTVEAFAFDMEANVRCSKVFRVQHLRHTRNGAYRLTDPRDVYEMVANNGARRLRACILGVIPGDIVDAAVEECGKTLTTNIDVSPESIMKMLVAFEDFKVTKEQIELRLQRHIDAITPAQFIGLRKIYNSLKDGMSKATDWFAQPVDMPEMGSKSEVLTKKLAKPKQEEPAA